ncbi:MAG: lysophospholipase [Solirubrobacterales bacterium]|nr:lysophospholipase [Solirubrobacterales bacterium]
MRTIEGSKGDIVVHQWAPVGEPEYVVLLAHGYAEHALRHAGLAEKFEADGAVVYAPDHRGHGRSGGEPALVDEAQPLIDDFAKVYDLAREEHPGLPIVLVGHSMGGLLATLFVQEGERPVDAVVLSSPLLGGNPALVALLDLDEIPDIPIDPMVISRDENEQQAYLDDPMIYHGPFRRETLEGLVAGLDRARSGGGFGDLPVLWIHGEGDMLVPYDLTAETMGILSGPGTQAKSYPEARHELFHEINREEVYKDVFDFIDQNTPEAAASTDGR